MQKKLSFPAVLWYNTPTEKVDRGGEKATNAYSSEMQQVAKNEVDLTGLHLDGRIAGIKARPSLPAFSNKQIKTLCKDQLNKNS